MPVGRALIAGSPYLGVYVRTSEGLSILPPNAPSGLERQVRELLGTATARATVQGTEVVGAMMAMNSHGAVVAEGIDPDEENELRSVVPVTRVASRLNAMGNNVLANDSGAIVHPDFSDAATQAIGRALGVPAHRGTIAGLGTVGMAGIATNRGVVVHPRATQSETEELERVLRVPAHRSTANFGVPIVGACLIANSRGLLVGLPTTPVEIVHLQEGFRIFE
ncbi:MAG: translation initiation factor IF-6 [Candidatus Thermoplasmatota archaeon]|nr:translation initiation factor IF-6 [Candidatus Thermoplasmatota archaeon]